MKRLLEMILKPSNYLKIVVCVMLAATSQPLIVYAFSELSEFFTTSANIRMLILNILIVVIAIFMAYLADNIKMNITYTAELELRKKIFASIYNRSIKKFNVVDSGEYYNQIGREVQFLQKHLYEAFINMIINIVTIIIIAILMLKCHYMSFIVVALFLIPLILNNAIMPEKIAECEENSIGTLRAMVVKLKDVLSGFESARFQEANIYIESVMNEKFTDGNNAEKKIQKLSNVSALIANASVTLSQFSGLFVAFYLVKTSQINLTQFILIFQLGMIINLPVVDLINSIISIKSSRPYIENASNILQDTYKEKTADILENIEEINLKNITFAYNDRKIFDNFSYSFEKGKKYLIVGESGSGKTTLIKLILGMIKPLSGKILYDRTDINNITNNEIYHHCGLVPQQIHIFDDTIKRNINLNGQCSDDKLNEIIKKTKLTKFMDTNNYNLDSMISDETIQVSGGEKARIAVARMLALDKSVIIYDEPLASLDSENAKAIEELLLSDSEHIIIHIAHTSSKDLENCYDDIIRI